MNSMNYFLILTFLFHLQILLVLTSNESFHTEQYCSFFSNRAPSPQPGLMNCTWYRENSCCRDNEVGLIFSQVNLTRYRKKTQHYPCFIKVRPLIGSSKKCTEFLNILMCYVCSPMQYIFYRGERLHVCLTYCDRMYSACATASMKGIRVRELYRNGREFCLSRRFVIHERDNSSECFTDYGLNIDSKTKVKLADTNINATNMERPSLLNLCLVICLAAMLSFILC